MHILSLICALIIQLGKFQSVILRKFRPVLTLEKDLLHQLAAQDPCFAELLTEQKRCQE